MDGSVDIGKKVIEDEISALELMRNQLGEVFDRIVEEIISCRGKVVLCGMGKSGHVARKISATMSSLGIHSFFLHPAEAMHGDLGMIAGDDIVILLSNSGETQEMIAIIPTLKVIGAKLISIIGRRESTLYREADISEVITIEKEACHLNLAPTSSTTAMMVYGDALAVAASCKTGFSASDFGLYHPSGALGKKVLMRVKDIMAENDKLPVVTQGTDITEAILKMSQKGLGVVGIVDKKWKLVGLLTDGDLRRAIEKKADLYNDVIDSIMTKNPTAISKDLLLVDALTMLRDSHFNNYPIVDESGRLIGMMTWQMINNVGIVL